MKHPFVGERMAILRCRQPGDECPSPLGLLIGPERGTSGGSGCKWQGDLGARESVLGKGIVPAVLGYEKEFCDRGIA